VEYKLFDRLVIQDMFLIDPFQGGFVDVVVPDAVWIDDHDGSAATYAETIDQTALNSLRIAQLVQIVGAV
jgi:hypothetical protein